MRSDRALAITCLLLAGCAVDQPVLTWTPTRDDASPVDRAVDRCQYETTSATQTPDYSVGYWLQGVDQKQRRNNLMIMCMRAQGYAAKTVSEGVGPQSKATWKRWEDEWAAAKEERALMGPVGRQPHRARCRADERAYSATQRPGAGVGTQAEL